MKSIPVYLLILTVLLSACGGPAAAPEAVPETVIETVEIEVPVTLTPAPEEPATVSFWHTYSENSPEVSMLIDTLIPMFEEQNPDITVEALSVPYDDFRSKLITSIAGGIAPDLARVDIIWVPELAEMGALAALDTEMADFDDYRAAVFPGPLSTTYWQGHYYGLPMTTNTKVWFYNQDLYTQAGLDGPPATIDELPAMCDSLKDLDEELYLFAADGTFAWVMLPWIWSFGGAVTDPEVTQASGYLNSPETVAAYEFWLEMMNRDCFAPVVLGSGIDPYTGFAQGQYASIDNGPWSFPILQGQYPDMELFTAPFPAGDGGSINVVGGEDIILFEQSPNKEAATAFLRFVLSSEYQLKMAEVGQLPVRPDLIGSDYIQGHPYYAVFLEQLETSQARTAHPDWQAMDEIITTAGQLILRGESSPQDALDAAAAEIDALLAP
ncbi:MAG: extracellular solute-binding protein [Anaerolineales bacterium]|nr:extracellular solute-binding protein [Anaerolineales bacterium]